MSDTPKTFEEHWAFYPRRTPEKDARAAWDAAIASREEEVRTLRDRITAQDAHQLESDNRIQHQRNVLTALEHEATERNAYVGRLRKWLHEQRAQVKALTEALRIARVYVEPARTFKMFDRERDLKQIDAAIAAATDALSNASDAAREAKGTETMADPAPLAPATVPSLLECDECYDTGRAIPSGLPCGFCNRGAQFNSSTKKQP